MVFLSKWVIWVLTLGHRRTLVLNKGKTSLVLTHKMSNTTEAQGILHDDATTSREGYRIILSFVSVGSVQVAIRVWVADDVKRSSQGCLRLPKERVWYVTFVVIFTAPIRRREPRYVDEQRWADPWDESTRLQDQCSYKKCMLRKMRLKCEVVICIID